MNGTEWWHFDPITLVVVVASVIVTWANLRKDSAWHTEWIQKHTEECDARERTTTAILSKLEQSHARLTTLTEGHHERLDRLERITDRNRLRE